MPSLEERLRRLEDEAAIEQLLVEFVAACDDGPYDADRIAALFADDAVLELGFLGRHEGREAIHAFFVDVGRRIVRTVHFQANYRIDVDGDEARGRWYGFETPTFDGRATWGAFTYDDRYVRRGGKWLIQRLEQRLEFFTDYVRGWARQRLTDV